MDYIRRKISDKVKEAHNYFPMTLITGPRQSGKTTLCRHLFPEYKFVNLESITMRRSAIDDPEGFIASLGSKAIIDEAHNVPELMSVIQAKVDEDKSMRFVLTGSCNFALMNRVSQSLAGRVAIFTLLPFALDELTDEYVSNPTDRIEFNGFYPGVIADRKPVDLFYDNYYTTYVERDVRDLLNIKNIDKFDRFVRLCAGRVSGEFNATSLSNEVGVSSTTVSEWLSILNASFITYTLQPYFANIGKRLTKVPKLYFYDTGLMVYLLGITSPEQLDTHPLRGAVFENMIVSEMIKRAYNDNHKPSLYFYREQSGKEVDLLQESADGIDLFEIKSSQTYRKEFILPMDYLKGVIKQENIRRTLIYDGATIAPSIYNFRDYFKM